MGYFPMFSVLSPSPPKPSGTSRPPTAPADRPAASADCRTGDKPAAWTGRMPYTPRREP